MPWVNNVDNKGESVVEKKTEIKQIAFRLNDRIEKTVEVKVIESQRVVTKAYT